MTIQRMDNVLIVVDDLDAVVSFFVELGMELEGKGPIEGRWVERVIGSTTSDRTSQCSGPRTAKAESSCDVPHTEGDQR